MFIKLKYGLYLIVGLFVAIDVSHEYCSKFGRHLLQHQCVLTPESSEGPYYIPNHLMRRDVREDRQGLPFKLKMTLTDINTCEPLANVSVDIWQCDASGEYSGFIQAPAGVNQPIDNATYLRGIQMTDSNGVVEFMTIFPGWYSPRTTHIHIQSHLGGRTIHTGQLYFSDKLTGRIGRYYPYNNTKTRRLKNDEDWLFKQFKGPESQVNRIRPLKGNRISNGLAGHIVIGLDPNEDSKQSHGKG